MVGIVYLFIAALIGLVVVLTLGVASVFVAIITVFAAPVVLLISLFFTQNQKQPTKSKEAMLAYHRMKYGGYEGAQHS